MGNNSFNSFSAHHKLVWYFHWDKKSHHLLVCLCLWDFFLEMDKGILLFYLANICVMVYDGFEGIISVSLPIKLREDILRNTVGSILLNRSIRQHYTVDYGIQNRIGVKSTLDVTLNVYISSYNTFRPHIFTIPRKQYSHFQVHVYIQNFICIWQWIWSFNIIGIALIGIIYLLWQWIQRFP